MAKILLIDDKYLVRNVLRMYLEVNEHEVVEASDGEEGIERYRESRPDLVITDIMMPVKDGFEMIRELRRGFPDVKIIAISGATFSVGGMELPAMEVALGMGALRAFQKPVCLGDLKLAVDELLNN